MMVVTEEVVMMVEEETSRLVMAKRQSLASPKVGHEGGAGRMAASE